MTKKKLIKKNNVSQGNTLIKRVKKNAWFYLFMMPAIIYFIVFRYLPMYGIVIAFKDYNIFKGIAESSWVGLKHFKFIYSLPLFHQVLKNTLVIGFLKILWTFPTPIILALMINELRSVKFKRIIQSSIYIPHFISWSVIGGLAYALFSPQFGILKSICDALGLEDPNLLMNVKYFRGLLVGATVWKTAGWGTIIYIAALLGVDPAIYEAAYVDGANRLTRIIYIALPSIQSVIFVVLLVNIGNVVNVGFASVMALQNPLVFSVSEIIETYVYKNGILAGRFSFTAAVGLFNSVIAFILVMGTNFIKKKVTGESII